MEITKVNIKGGWVGIIGLTNIFENLRNSTIVDEKGMKDYLLQEVKKQNYIAKSAEDGYNTALFRQYQLFIGEEVKEEENGMIIKILGPGCTMCEKLEKEVMDILTELNVAADLEHVRDLNEITQYKILCTPALVINNKIKSTGRIPGKNKLKKWITEEVNEIK